jgi:hypothetical protein
MSYTLCKRHVNRIFTYVILDLFTLYTRILYTIICLIIFILVSKYNNYGMEPKKFDIK